LPALDWEAVGTHRWGPALAGLRADALDCLQTTAALLADHAHGPGTHLALGRPWRFPARDANGVVTVQVSPADRLADATRLLGLRVEWSQDGLDGPSVRARLADGGPLYVIADAVNLPWLPYFGHARMPHSFLIEPDGERYLVVDAYHNDTEWGPARPGAWTLPRTTVDSILADGVTGVAVHPTNRPPDVDRADVLADNAANARSAAPAIDAYTDRLRTHLADPGVITDLVLDIWLLSRERALHAAWLADDPAAGPVAVRAEAWQRLSTQSYLVSRRMRRGGPPNSTVVDDLARLLHDDIALAVRLTEPSDEDSEVTAVVMAALGELLGLAENTLRTTDTLRSLPGFSSFRLVEVIDSAEHRLGVRLPDDLAADDLRDVAGLCRLFTSAKRRAPAVGAGS